MHLTPQWRRNVSPLLSVTGLIVEYRVLLSLLIAVTGCLFAVASAVWWLRAESRQLGSSRVHGIQWITKGPSLALTLLDAQIASLMGEEPSVDDTLPSVSHRWWLSTLTSIVGCMMLAGSMVGGIALVVLIDLAGPGIGPAISLGLAVGTLLAMAELWERLLILRMPASPVVAWLREIQRRRTRRILCIPLGGAMAGTIVSVAWLDTSFEIAGTATQVLALTGATLVGLVLSVAIVLFQVLWSLRHEPRTNEFAPEQEPHGRP